VPRGGRCYGYKILACSGVGLGMKCKIIVLLLLTGLSAVANADTSDYIWNEQFSKKVAEAEAGKTRSQYDIGNMYLKGQGTGINEQKAFSWFNKAAASGHVKSQFKVGLMLLNGTGVKRDYAKAEKWLRKAAKQNYAPGQYHYAIMYRDGKFLAKNYNKSLFWLKRAKDNGYWKAQNEYDRISALVQQTNRNKVVQPRPKKVVVARKQVNVRSDLRQLLLSGQWLERGKPAKYLPSALTECKTRPDGLLCTSKKEIKGKRGNTQFTYRIVIRIRNISEDGEFSATYQNEVLSVVPGEPIIIPGEDGEPDVTRPSPLIDKGLQRTVHSLECELDNAKQITCVKDQSRTIKLTRQ